MACRPRSLDRDEALESALDAFWERGYDGVSTAELTAAMGIGAPSLRDRDVIRDRVLRGHDQGEMPTDTDVESLTDLVDVVLAGVSARARDGATRTRLDATVDRVLASWPTPPDR